MNSDYMKKFVVASALPCREGAVKSMSFSACGAYLIVSYTSKFVDLINVNGVSAESRYKYQCPKYGCGIVRFPGLTSGKALLTSTLVDHNVREIDLEVKEYVRTFEGHTDTVLSMESSHNHLLVTTSKDATARVWDLRVQNAIYCLDKFIEPVATVDPVGSIFFLGHKLKSAQHSVLQQYDIRSFRGAFRESRIESGAHVAWTSLKLSNSSKYLAIATNDRPVHMVYKDGSYYTFRGE